METGLTGNDINHTIRNENVRTRAKKYFTQ